MKTITVLVVMPFAIFGCGPGISDGAYSIAGGYEFHDTGSNGKTIRYEANGVSVTVIPARVDQYILDGKVIVVARRPVQGLIQDQIGKWVVSDECEFWAIDMPSHVARRITDTSAWPDLACKPKEAVF